MSAYLVLHPMFLEDVRRLEHRKLLYSRGQGKSGEGERKITFDKGLSVQRTPTQFQNTFLCPKGSLSHTVEPPIKDTPKEDKPLNKGQNSRS